MTEDSFSWHYYSVSKLKNTETPNIHLNVEVKVYVSAMNRRSNIINHTCLHIEGKENQEIQAVVSGKHPKTLRSSYFINQNINM